MSPITIIYTTLLDGVEKWFWHRWHTEGWAETNKIKCAEKKQNLGLMVNIWICCKKPEDCTSTCELRNRIRMCELNMPILWANYVKKSRSLWMRKLGNVYNQQWKHFLLFVSHSVYASNGAARVHFGWIYLISFSACLFYSGIVSLFQSTSYQSFAMAASCMITRNVVRIVWIKCKLRPNKSGVWKKAHALHAHTQTMPLDSFSNWIQQKQ